MPYIILCKTMRKDWIVLLIKILNARIKNQIMKSLKFSYCRKTLVLDWIKKITFLCLILVSVGECWMLNDAPPADDARRITCDNKTLVTRCIWSHLTYSIKLERLQCNHLNPKWIGFPISPHSEHWILYTGITTDFTNRYIPGIGIPNLDS